MTIILAASATVILRPGESSTFRQNIRETTSRSRQPRAEEIPMLSRDVWREGGVRHAAREKKRKKKKKQREDGKNLQAIFTQRMLRSIRQLISQATAARYFAQPDSLLAKGGRGRAEQSPNTLRAWRHPADPCTIQRGGPPPRRNPIATYRMRWRRAPARA